MATIGNADGVCHAHSAQLVEDAAFVGVDGVARGVGEVGNLALRVATSA